jgi:hypothetical protein
MKGVKAGFNKLISHDKAYAMRESGDVGDAQGDGIKGPSQLGGESHTPPATTKSELSHRVTKVYVTPPEKNNRLDHVQLDSLSQASTQSHRDATFSSPLLEPYFDTPTSLHRVRLCEARPNHQPREPIQQVADGLSSRTTI